MDGGLASKTVDDETTAAIVVKWQQYLNEAGVATSDITQNHVTSFITHCSGDLDKLLARFMNNPQMGKSLVRTIISNHGKKYASDGSLRISMSEIDEDLEDIHTAEDQYVHSLLSDSTTDLAQRQRVGSFSSSVSTNITSKYDHLASMLRTDVVKHSFYGSPERDESPLVSPTVSELPSPETSVSRKHLSSIDDLDADYLQETNRSTVEVLEWSNGLHGFRKAASATEIDHSAHDFRFLHPMNKPLFPPGYVYTHNHHAPLRERSPVRSTSGIGSLGQKLFTSPPRHSPSRVVLPTISESDAASGRSDSAPKFASEVVTEDLGVVTDSAAQSEISSKSGLDEVNKTKSIADASSQSFRFPDVVYESSTFAPIATREVSTSSNSSNKYKLLYLSATNELLRRKLQRKQKQAKKKKTLVGTKIQGDRETVKSSPAAVFCSPVKEGNNEREETNEAEDAEEEVESDAISMVTAVTATASHDIPSQPHAATISAGMNSPSKSADEPRSPTQDTPIKSPLKSGPSGATRHKAENELTFKVARFLLPFLIAIVLYVGGRYYYKTQVLNIWQNQQRLTDNAPPPLRHENSLHRRSSQPTPSHAAPSAPMSAKTKDTRENNFKATSSPPPASSPSSPAEPLYEEFPEDLHQGSLSLHVSIRGLDGRAYSPGNNNNGKQRSSRGGHSTVANVYSGQFSAFRHAW
eukprot:CAMPEP_0185014680 /NCGR_PEP_ID=MMETSP1098-20130426/99443_1 /TAXON_ID=89044 /ORGANISM="Spumella elongata, Strain CCAP 955/1" /LENGTH=694 /DNA_ID=CAMNT_0027543779 /DNA_START=81 /DNA_END=2162 /DNA_ORIENTATION=-